MLYFSTGALYHNVDALAIHVSLYVHKKTQQKTRLKSQASPLLGGILSIALSSIVIGLWIFTSFAGYWHMLYSGGRIARYPYAPAL